MNNSEKMAWGFYWLQKMRGGEKAEIVYIFSFSADKFPVHGKPSGYYFEHVWCENKDIFLHNKNALIFGTGTVIDVSSNLPQYCNLFLWWFVCSSGFWTYEKLVTLCIFYSLFYTGRLMSVCNMITMAEDLCGQLPAQTPVDPDQIKLFFSILNYMMHLGEKKKNISLVESSLQRVWDFQEQLGTPRAWLMPGCWSTAQMKTENCRAIECLGPRLQPQRLPPYPLSREVVGLCCGKRSGLSFCLPAVHAQH